MRLRAKVQNAVDAEPRVMIFGRYYLSGPIRFHVRLSEDGTSAYRGNVPTIPVLSIRRETASCSPR